jgi:chemotaxis protein CheX
MDAKYINPFLVAIKDIFDTMIDLPVTIGKPFIKKDKIPSYYSVKLNPSHFV